MFLSTEQTRVAMHGIDNNLVWRPVERPVGPQPLPSWVKGAEVDWHEGYGNSPSVRLLVDHEARDWPNKRFQKFEGGYYRAFHEDGRMEQYGHIGKVSLAPIKRFRSADGTLRAYRRSGPEWADTGTPAIGQQWNNGEWVRYGYEPGEWVEVEMPATTKQEGFGGAHIFLTMADETELVLRGPWHVGAPEGYAEVSYKIRGDHGARGGLYITDDLFVRIMSRFQAHLDLAEVTYGRCTTFEPMKPEWGEPKRLVYEREWLARKLAHEAASKAEARHAR